MVNGINSTHNLALVAVSVVFIIIVIIILIILSCVPTRLFFANRQRLSAEHKRKQMTGWHPRQINRVELNHRASRTVAGVVILGAKRDWIDPPPGCDPLWRGWGVCEALALHFARMWRRCHGVVWRDRAV
jgi:hypothetical protein